jgi:excisionase family DNA binding protein
MSRLLSLELDERGLRGMECPPPTSRIIRRDFMKATEVRPLAVRGKEAARLLGISERTLARLKAGGQLSFVKVGAVILFPIEGLERWIADHQGVAV